MNDYKYIKIPLTPSIIEELTIKLFNEKTIERNHIVEQVSSYHIENGGLPAGASDLSRSVKRALEIMAEKEWATNPSYGYWSIHKKDAPNAPAEKEIMIDEEEALETVKIPSYTIYGKGASTVYLYYFEAYKKLALLEGKETWYCKIGRSDRDPLNRIYSQASTALPESPTIAYVIKTDNASLLETMLHSVLKVKGNHLKNAPGSEWFDTNPDEIIKIIESINKEILHI